MFNFGRENKSLLASWWRNIDKTILILIILLFFFGLFFSFSSTSSMVGEKLNKESYFLFLKHFLFVCIALIIIFFISIQRRETIKNYLPYFFLASFLLLLLVPFIGVEIKGAKRWINLFFLPRFQPIEILKPFIIVMVALILSSKNKSNLYLKYFLSFLLIFPIIILLISQPDLGQTILIFLTWFALIFVSGINLFLFFAFFGLMISIILYLIFFVPKFEYILIRITSFFDPSLGNNYQSEKASEAIINGGFFGKGIGEGVLKNRVPEAHTDYIVSVISEEFGVIVIILLMIVFLFFIYQVFKKLYFEKNNKIKLILVGSSSIILFQALIHLGVNIRLFPTTGMTLPFLSYGGSSTVGTAIVAGLMINLTKKSQKIL